ncbi:MAG: hypothetical protein A2275_18130 [Bacteroidetes bacterium RIFOXYA12_FULL_35_11]|nr:MAG: hypothetical protein A2X01_21245 [Bacteroidetes bacterium GWF2_35_48]OFY82182.1 MAG: hypothetical protein A2275_18130 [Bacteroidetes bacterium RIFOXYA12_FULL_35_11]OFY95503.1 MAG: hypothetical protein A2491_03785 [Bacteroidetes bacterium RIFOXYC12_FULL_35_7]OFY97680.1 MAG: hypothetical protein A2309_05520 [Bacteroidetes bacterium RIFOXYB2_FULL_35_7]HBX50474.1 hypothetical protein [Bacteroidales bacterium]
MKIAYIVPGTGEAFYCGNCLRDSSFIKAFQKAGHEIITVPMYLPLTLKEDVNRAVSPIFYGAVNLYLKQQSPVFKKLPKFISNWLNSMPVLKFAARKAGSTRSEGLEEMTLSMLRGENGNQAAELQVLINWLNNNYKPDVVHLSNALLIGMAPEIKKKTGAKVICSLQDEDEWVDEMRTEYQQKTWDLILEKSAFVDAFIAVSHYFKKLILSKISVPENKIHVVYNGVNPDFYSIIPDKNTLHSIGYLSRIFPPYGLDILVDAFLFLKKDKNHNDLSLKISGGYTKDDLPFLKGIKKKLKEQGQEKNVFFYEDFSEQAKKEFLNSISIFSVPARRKEAIGMHLLEAMASGVPVIQPDHGAYSEIINATNAGLLYSPNTAEALAETLNRVLTENELYRTLQANCRQGINVYFNSVKQVQELYKIYSR